MVIIQQPELKSASSLCFYSGLDSRHWFIMLNTGIWKYYYICLLYMFPIYNINQWSIIFPKNMPYLTRNPFVTAIKNSTFYFIHERVTSVRRRLVQRKPQHWSTCVDPQVDLWWSTFLQLSLFSRFCIMNMQKRLLRLWHMYLKP